MRMAVAASVLMGMVAFNHYVGRNRVLVYNGLAVPVQVSVGNQTVSVSPLKHQSVWPPHLLPARITTQTADGRPIESFVMYREYPIATYIYNVGAAQPLVRRIQTYGNAQEEVPLFYVAHRTLPVSAQHVLEAPPSTISSENGGGTRSVVESLAYLPPHQQASFLDDPVLWQKIVALHARLDDAQARYTGDWMKSSLDLGIAEEILAERLAHDPMDFIALRQQQNRAFKDGDDKRLKELEQLFQGHPDSDAAVFLSLRQMPPGRKRNEKTLATQKRFQDSHLLTSAMMRVQIQQELFVAAEQTLRRLMMSKKISSDRAALELLRLSRLQNADVPINPQQQARTYDSFPVASMYQQGQADPATFGVFWVYMDAGNFEKAAKWLQENEASENAIPWKWIALALCVPDNDEIVQHALNLQPSD
ncbi:MAG: hypothetical protein AAFP90_22595, partial [Planctomycetota bacterium]